MLKIICWSRRRCLAGAHWWLGASSRMCCRRWTWTPWPTPRWSVSTLSRLVDTCIFNIILYIPVHHHREGQILEQGYHAWHALCWRWCSDWLCLDNNKCCTTAQVKEARTRARGTVAAPSSPWRRRILSGTLSSEWSAGASAVLRWN